MFDWYLRGGGAQPEGQGRLLGQEGTPGAAQAIPLNIYEGDDELVVIAPMPGIEADDLEISVLGDELRLRAAERGPGQERRSYLLREWSYGPYERRVHLPYTVDADAANTSLGNGVLVLTLPRSATARPRKIALARN